MISEACDRPGRGRRHSQPFLSEPLARGPFHFPAAQQVNMKMRDAFAAILTIIDNKAESFTAFRNPEFTGDLAGNDKQVPEGGTVIIMCLAHPGNGFFRDYKDVVWCLWINIPECNREIVLVDDVCRDLARDYTLKQGRLGHLSLLDRAG